MWLAALRGTKKAFTSSPVPRGKLHQPTCNISPCRLDDAATASSRKPSFQVKDIGSEPSLISGVLDSPGFKLILPPPASKMRGQQQNHGERPYRSHLRPACLPCRRRKSRCQSEADTSVCLMCRAHGTDCVYPGDSQAQQPSSARTTPSAKHRRRSITRQRTPASVTGPSGASGPLFRTPAEATHPSAMDRTRLPNLVPPAPPPIHSSTGNNMYEEDLFDSSADDQAQNLHIVGPAVTKDSQVLSDYLSAIPGATRGTRMVVPVPANRSGPVLFTRVQKRPVGISLNRSPSAEKLEIIEQLIGLQASDVIDV